MPTNLDPATLRAVEAEMSRLMQPEDGTGRYLDVTEAWNSLLVFLRAAAPRPVAQCRHGATGYCPHCDNWPEGYVPPPPPAEAREELQHWHLCEAHQPERWESDGTCPICEGHALRAQVEALTELAAAAYQMAGACDAPVRWLDALSKAVAGRPFSVDGLLPFTDGEAERRGLDRAIAVVEALDVYEWSGLGEVVKLADVLAALRAERDKEA